MFRLSLDGLTMYDETPVLERKEAIVHRLSHMGTPRPGRICSTRSAQSSIGEPQRGAERGLVVRLKAYQTVDREAA